MRVIQKEEWHRYPFAQNGCFGVSCNKKLVIGGGSYSDGQSTMKVFEESDSSSHQFQPIMPLNSGRTGASAAYSKWHQKLIIAGGTSTYLDDYTLYDLRNVELLDMNPSLPSSSFMSTNRWIVCKDKIPGIFGANVEVFSMQDKILLADVEYNKVYEGRMVTNPYKNTQKWNPVPSMSILWAALPSMLCPRYNHTMVVLGDKLLLSIGGHSISDDKCAKTCEYFSYESNTWNIGPELPFCLQQAQILPLDEEDEEESLLRCIIIGGIRDHNISPVLSLFDLGRGDIVNFKGTLDKSLAVKCTNTKHLENGPNRNVAILM